MKLTPANDSTGIVRAEVFRLAKLAGAVLPDYALDLDVDDLSVSNPGMDKRGFADQNRQYPIYKKGCAFWSAIYAHQSEDAKLIEATKKASDLYRITDDVTQFLAKLEEGKKAVAKRAWAITVGEGADALNELPIHNPHAIQASAKEFLNQYEALPFDVRHKAANAILDQADHFAVILPHRETLEKIACRGDAIPSDVRMAFISRTNWTTGEQTEHLLKFANQSNLIAAQPPEERRKLAEELERIDRSLRIPKAAYGSMLPEPVDALFGLAPSAAKTAAANSITTKTGSVYSKSQMNTLPLYDLTCVLGPLWKHAHTAAIVESLLSTGNEDTARKFDMVLKSAGIHPVPADNVLSKLPQHEIMRLASEFAA